MAHAALIESEQSACRSSGAEGATHAMGASRGRGKRVRTEGVIETRGDVVTENDCSDQPFAACMHALARGERGGNDGASRMVARRRMGIIGLIRVRQHAVGKGGMDRTGQQSR